jgi:capsule polysaccharide export protein KpsC/LpsZ
VSPSPNRTNDVNSTRVRLEQIARDLNQPIQTVEPSLAEWTDLAALKVFRAGLTDNVANLVTNGAPEGFYALLCGIKVHVCEVATTYTMRGLTTDHDLPFRRGRPCDRNDLMAAVLTLSRFVVPKSGLIDPFELA